MPGPRRLPTWEERAKRAAEREARFAALRRQGDAVRRELAALAQRCAAVATESQDTADERLAAQLGRLEAARQALELAAQLLQVDRPDEVLSADGPTAIERQAQLVAALGQWRRSSGGWWETRMVARPAVVDNGAKVSVEWLWHGPYLYQHWREGGRQETRYHGLSVPDEAPAWVEEAITPPQAPTEEQLGPLTRQALQLARAIHEELSSELLISAKRRKRLRRVLRRAMRRATRRARAEAPPDVVRHG
jgi:hypothetical protein